MHTLPQRQVHLDFHTSEHVPGIGSKFDKKQFQDCLKKGHVNSITVFAKCHHGWAYFPSETNQIHPHLDFDLLGKMLEACAEIGVQAPIYISAGFDEKYFYEHPDHSLFHTPTWATPNVLEENGMHYVPEHGPGYHVLCMNSPYFDVLISQVEEVVRKYDPVGIFLDIVGERACFCPYCRAEIEKLGWDPEDHASYYKLAGVTYKKYYEGINAAARAIKPDVRIFHNQGHIPCGRRDFASANTHQEIESLPTGGWGYDHFPKSAKYAALLDSEYLGMTGKFHTTWGEFGGFKHPNALRYEIALSLANGACCSIGDQMHPEGFLDEATYELIGIAYAEAEKVEQYCYDVTPLADIGVLSIESIIGTARNHPADTGSGRMLLEGKYLYNVLDTDCDFSKYKLLILPDAALMTNASLLAKLKAFVAGGGKLLCSGTSGTDGTSMLFDFGINWLGKGEYQPTYLRPTFEALGLPVTSYVMYSTNYRIEQADPDASVLGYCRYPFFNRERGYFCSHQHAPFVTKDASPAVVIGKDGGYIAWDIFSEYADKGSIILKEIVLRTIDTLLGDSKTLTTNLPSAGVVTLNDQPEQSRYVLHALYATPVKRGNGIEVIEDLVPIYHTTFEIKTDKQIKRVTAVPQNTEIPFTCENGVCKFAIDKFACSQIVTLEY